MCRLCTPIVKWGLGDVFVLKGALSSTVGSASPWPALHETGATLRLQPCEHFSATSDSPSVP
jgi:hypothetical protein